MNFVKFIIMILVLFSLPNNAYAYIGPGMGVGAIVAIIGILISIILAIFGIIYYPLKKIKKYIKQKKEKETFNKK